MQGLLQHLFQSNVALDLDLLRIVRSLVYCHWLNNTAPAIQSPVVQNEDNSCMPPPKIILLQFGSQVHRYVTKPDYQGHSTGIPNRSKAWRRHAVTEASGAMLRLFYVGIEARSNMQKPRLSEPRV